MGNLKQCTDTQLILFFQEGKLAAFSELLERYKDKIFTAIFFMVKDRYLAEDLFQETFIRIIDTLCKKQYNEEGKVLPWMMRIAHNLCIDHFRKAKRNPLVVSNQNDISQIIENLGNDTSLNAEQRLIRNENNQMLMQMLNRLPDLQREVVVLRHFADLSFKEIASLTNCSINTSLGRMRYALLALRKMANEKELVN